MNGQSINYEHLAKEALRSVVKTVLKQVTTEGLPGEHHFYISFHTTAPGVKISNRISAQYPKEMTIVLQHQFWDLKVEEEHFEVRLSFSNIPELLVIPYSAVKVFFDPSVPYGLQFDHSSRPEAVEDKSSFLEDSWHMQPDNGGQNIENITPSILETDMQASTLNANEEDIPPYTSAENSPENHETEDDRLTPVTEMPEPESSEIEEVDKDGAEIVSLDAFRKKNN